MRAHELLEDYYDAQAAVEFVVCSQTHVKGIKALIVSSLRLYLLLYFSNNLYPFANFTSK